MNNGLPPTITETGEVVNKLVLSQLKAIDWATVKFEKRPVALRMRNVSFGIDHYSTKQVWFVFAADGTVLDGGRIPGRRIGPYKSDKPVFPTRRSAQDWAEWNAGRFAH